MMTSTETKINQSNGKFFSIVYKNMKGEINKYVCRTGVKKGLKGGTNNCPPEAKTLYCVTKNGKPRNDFNTFYVDMIFKTSLQ